MCGGCTCGLNDMNPEQAIELLTKREIGLGLIIPKSVMQANIFSEERIALGLAIAALKAVKAIGQHCDDVIEIQKDAMSGSIEAGYYVMAIAIKGLCGQAIKDGDAK